MQCSVRLLKTMKLKNLTGTSTETCNCDSWLDHWEKYAERKAGACGVLTCNNTADVGAHVRKYGDNDYTPYIYPLCSGCNQSSEVLDAWDGYPLVSPDACA
jgi:hypothetical protein